MIYPETVKARFITRLNRFEAVVGTESGEETVHVKNTGRCRELLLPGCDVILAKSHNPGRKTAFDLIAVCKAGRGWINMDSQAPNKAVKEYLEKLDWFDEIIPEYRYGSSRIDFFLRKAQRRILLEIKGCTLETGGQGYFPDAPTSRGTRHLLELDHARQEGFESYIGFVIQINGIESVLPCGKIDPVFADTFTEVTHRGVRVINFHCTVAPDQLVIADRENLFI